jgi:hypothetical protein
MLNYFIEHSPGFDNVVGPNPQYTTLIGPTRTRAGLRRDIQLAAFFTTVPRVIDAR